MDLSEGRKPRVAPPSSGSTQTPDERETLFLPLETQTK